MIINLMFTTYGLVVIRQQFKFDNVLSYIDVHILFSFISRLYRAQSVSSTHVFSSVSFFFSDSP